MAGVVRFDITKDDLSQLQAGGPAFVTFGKFW